jgi:hypothetical protein
MLAKDKHVVWIRNLAEVADDDGHMRGFMIDITDRKRVEETLRVLGAA